MVRTVTILLLENLSFPLAFGFLVKVSFAIPRSLSSFLILAWNARYLCPSLPKREGPTFPGTWAQQLRTSSGPAPGSDLDTR